LCNQTQNFTTFFCRGRREIAATKNIISTRTVQIFHHIAGKHLSGLVLD